MFQKNVYSRFILDYLGIEILTELLVQVHMDYQMLEFLFHKTRKE